MATTAPQRILTLDIVRGIAVMGILAMNIVAFAMPLPAYFNPFAMGAASTADLTVYAFNFILIDGKMRGLFSFLFGASTMLVIERAREAGQSEAKVTYSRMIWLLVFGLIHFYLIWFGDILISYALAGMVAFLFRNRSVKSLVGWGLALVLLQFAILAASAFQAHSLAAAVAGPSPSAEALRHWAEFAGDFAASPEELRDIVALHLGPWTALVESQVTDHLAEPFVFALFFGPETLAYMLFGMAALKSGLLTGAWPEQRYERWALYGFALTIPIYTIICWRLFAEGFTVPAIFTWYLAATVPFRPVMVAAYASLIIILTQNGGWLVERIAAAGRAAFTNYLGTSIVMTALFYGWGLGLYGSLGRAELVFVVVAAWLLMLAWSKPWLDRFTYGPLEWLWRSLARGRMQALRKPTGLKA